MSQKNTLFNYFVSPARKTIEHGSAKTTPDRNKEQKTPKTKLKSPTTPRSNKAFTPKLSPGGSSKKNGNEVSSKVYEVCDIVWSKLQGYPWWPSLICNHPKLLTHIKDDAVHVQFFDNPPTRAWVKKNHVEPYKSSSDKAAPNKDTAKWKDAASEADNALLMTLEFRKKLIRAFSNDGSDEEDGNDLMEVDSDDEVKLNSSGNSANDADKENQEAPPLKKLLLDSDDSEDEYKPAKDDLNVVSDSASSGVDSEKEEFSGEEPENSPVKRKKNTKYQQAGKKQKLNNGKPLLLNNSRPSLANEAIPKLTEKKSEGFRNDWAHLKFEFLKPHKIRDANRRTPDDPNYDSRTVYVPEDFKRNLTPAMKQWWDIKEHNFDCVLFFKVGKFYELYHMDAVTGVNELGLLFMKGEFAHSGFPEIAYSRFSTAIVEKGYKVARVEQTETPDMMAERLKGVFRATKFDKVVKREVCQITTKGTRTCSVLDGEAVEVSSRFLLALIEKELDSNRSSYGVCFVDTSIGIFNIGQFSDDRYCSQLRMLIAHNPPVQVLYCKKTLTDQTQQLLTSVLTNVLKEPLSQSEFWPADKTLLKLAEGDYFPKKETGGVGWPDGLKPFLSETDTVGLSPRDEYSLAISALGAVTWYLQKCFLDQQLIAMGQFEEYVPSSTSSSRASAKEIMPKYMILDGITLRNLDILECSGGQEGVLLHHLDSCSTKFGKRLLRQWVCSPLCNIESIKSRQEAITDLSNHTSLVKEVRAKLSQLPDLERLLASIHAQGNAVRSKTHPDSRAIFYEEKAYSKRKIQNFIATLNGFRSSTKIVSLFQDDNVNVTSKLLLMCTSTSSCNGGKFPEIEESLDFFYSAFDHEAATTEGRIVPSGGVDPEYDSILEELEKINIELQKYLEEQRKFFGCKVTYIGTDKKRFQIEVPEAAARKAGNEYELQSQRKGFKRFTTSKSKNLLAQLIQAEEQKKSVLQDLSRRVFEQFGSKYELWSDVIKCLSVLDVLISLAVYTENAGGNMCIPQFEIAENERKPFVKIKDGRHPCVLCTKNFVSNDTVIGCEDSDGAVSSLVLVTGPNMGGKSTLMRQLGLLTIMAHIGCHVPAEECILTPVDRIFTRIGASDDILAGESTFFVELSETSAIIRQASKHSLVLVDELGRGTSTHDGTAIAAATVKEFVHSGCRTLFSTHYHSLVDGFKNTSGITMRHMACMVEEDTEDPTQETVTFLYKFEAGACPKSYGFNAARLGGIPSFITSRAYVKAKEIEQESHARKLFSSVCKTSDLKSIIAQIKSL